MKTCIARLRLRAKIINKNSAKVMLNIAVNYRKQNNKAAIEKS